MKIAKLTLRDFRNHDAIDLSFSDGLTLISGENGAGKTNLAEAIHYLSLAKSWRTSDSAPLIKEGCETAALTARIEEGQLSRDIAIEITPKGRRIRVNGKPIRRLSELSALFNVVLFEPEDAFLFKGPPTGRRAFLDAAIAKQSPDYLTLVGRYNHLLEDRNAALKAEEVDRDYIAVLTTALIDVSAPIEAFRRRYISGLNKILSELVTALYDAATKAEIVHHPFIANGDFKEIASGEYARALQEDIARKTTSIGVHREDFALLLNDKDVARYGSQGENRLAAIALRLAPYFLIEEEAKKPVAVLDDVYSELDDEHAARLTALLKRMGQTFVTAANTPIEGASVIEVSDHKAIRRK